MHQGIAVWPSSYDSVDRKCAQLPATATHVPVFVLQSAVTLITPQKSPDISDIPVDSGAIVTRAVNKGYKEAVYKDPKGKVETFSGLCPHLGCQLQASAECKAYVSLR